MLFTALTLAVAGCSDDGARATDASAPGDGSAIDEGGAPRDSGPGEDSAQPQDGAPPRDGVTPVDSVLPEDGGGGSCVPKLPTFADGKAPTKTLHVKAGAAAGGDGSASAPFATLSAAVAKAQPGTRILVEGSLTASTYTTNLSGSAAAPIWISGKPGAQIGPLTLEGAEYVVVEDLELIGTSKGHVLHFFSAKHLLFRKLKVHKAGLGCMKGSQTTNAYVEDSEMWDAGKQSSHPILDFVGVNTGHIVRSKFHQGPGVMIMLKGGTSDMLFAWNEVYDQSSPGNVLALGQSTGPQFFFPLDSAYEGLRIVAFANVIHDVTGAPFAFEGCKDCAAVHNTAFKVTGAQLLRFLPGKAGQTSGATISKSTGCRFSGNIIVGGKASGATLNADAQNVGAGNVVDYNVFLKPGNLNWWGVIPQDKVHSTYTKDPKLDAKGVPQDLALVNGKGPPTISALPLASKLVRGFGGKCLEVPGDIGAYVVP